MVINHQYIKLHSQHFKQEPRDPKTQPLLKYPSFNPGQGSSITCCPGGINQRGSQAKDEPSGKAGMSGVFGVGTSIGVVVTMEALAHSYQDLHPKNKVLVHKNDIQEVSTTVPSA